MTLPRLLILAANLIGCFLFAARLSGFVGNKTFAKWLCVMFALFTISDAATRRFGVMAVDALLTALWYVIWKSNDDDDDRPRRRRRALRSKLGKVLPRPKTASPPVLT